MPTFLLIDDSDQLVTLFSGVATPETMGIPTLGGGSYSSGASAKSGRGVGGRRRRRFVVRRKAYHLYTYEARAYEIPGTLYNTTYCHAPCL